MFKKKNVCPGGWRWSIRQKTCVMKRKTINLMKKKATTDSTYKRGA